MNNILTKVSEYVSRSLIEKLPAGCAYHNLDHTKEVVEAAEEIGSGSGLSAEELEMVLIAAWFHDIGLINGYENHEKNSAGFAEEFLKKENYPANRIDKIAGIIMVTQLINEPENLMEKVIRDADIIHLGRKGFNKRSRTLRTEWENMLGKNFSDEEWNKQTLAFAEKNKFYTEYAQNNFGERRLVNMEKIRKRLDKEDSEKKPDKKKLKIVSDKSNPGRGIETMFRNTIRTHVEFSSMADNKANIMISVNTLLLTLIFALLARKLDTNQHLMIPTAIVTFVSLTTLVFAIIVTRPKVTAGTFTEEDIKKKRANLLFFGNFFKMDLKTFQWGMNEMMSDRDFLYGNMVRDLYDLGQVLGRKYKYLRICYNIFMYGLILSVIAFTIAILLYPGGTSLTPLID